MLYEHTFNRILYKDYIFLGFILETYNEYYNIPCPINNIVRVRMCVCMYAMRVCM